jgi:ring-1,2-phenylacetyl-CoA epoxidase subunit PaaB
MSDTQLPIWEVFHQEKRGAPHVHVGAVHASDEEIALQMAKEQFARRLNCVSLWVVREDQVVKTDYDDPFFFARATDKSYRESSGFPSPLKGFKRDE